MLRKLKLAVGFVFLGVASTALGAVLLSERAGGEMQGMGWPLVVVGPAVAVLGVVLWPRAGVKEMTRGRARLARRGRRPLTGQPVQEDASRLARSVRRRAAGREKKSGPRPAK
jgi:hypothetical protein